MEKKGFFKFNKLAVCFILIVILIDILMFTPWMFGSATAVGTSWNFIIVNIILITAPSLALLEGLLFKSKKDETPEHEQK